MQSNLIFLVLLLVVPTSPTSACAFQKICKEALDRGRAIIENNVPLLVQEETTRLHRRLKARTKEILNAEVLYPNSLGFVKYLAHPNGVGVTSPPPCPAPNRTMFTTPAPTVASTTTQKSTKNFTTAASTVVSSTPQRSTTDNSSSAGTPSLDTKATQKTTTVQITLHAEEHANELPGASKADDASTSNAESTNSFVMPKFYSTTAEYDPFHNWMMAIYKYMFKTEEICNQPPMTDLNSITEDQLYGFLATLAAVYPGPFCSLCDRYMAELRERVFIIHPLQGEDEQHIMRFLYANIPSPKAFCSTIAPGCYENYENRVRNITEAVICLECSACMTISNVIQHRFLLDKELMKKFLQFLRSSFFHNACAELCEIWQPLNLTLFPHGFTYDGCMTFLTDNFQGVVDDAIVILRPERICSLELQWCELNETPNMLHCLRELCEESLGDTPQTRWLCSQIPDTPTLADQFLNVHQTKVYKSRKAYHDKYLSKDVSWHDEL